MNVCPRCHANTGRDQCPKCGAETLPYMGQEEDFAEIRAPRERRFILRWGGALIRLTVLLVIIMLLWYWSGGNIISLLLPSSGRVVPEETEFTMIRSATFTANSYTELTYDLFMPDNSSYQTVKSIQQEPTGVMDPYNEKHVTWNLNIPAGQSVSVTVKYTIKAKTVKQDMTSSDSGTLKDIPQELIDQYIRQNVIEEDEDNDVDVAGKNGQQFFKDENRGWTIDPQNSEVQERATALKQGKVKVYDMVKSVYDWIRNEFEYSNIGDPTLKTCGESLEASNRSGDCDDQSVVMISILRAMGIPSWLELGMLYNAQTHTWFGHGWAAVVIPKTGGGYITAQVDLVNDFFLFRDPFRFTEYVDDGDGDKLQDYYTVIRWTGNMNPRTKFTDKNFDESGQVWVDEEPVIPDAGTMGMAVSMGVVIVIYRRRHRRDS